MSNLINVVLGLAFLGLAIANTLLMFRLWAYPFDHETHKSSAPPLLMLVHRATGYLYLAIYIYLMIQMVPRMWTFQVELPARTVMHLTLGMSIGVIILIKITIVRFFKHLESSLIPFLGTMLLIFTFLLLGLSVPFNLREVQLSSGGVGGGVYSDDNIERVKNLLPKAGFPQEVSIDELATPSHLRDGRRVLLSRCVQCHDLRTILVRPRTPANWLQTVGRMGERSQLLNPINQTQMWDVTAYLIAISPNLQASTAEKRQQQNQAESVQDNLRTAILNLDSGTLDLDIKEARSAFESQCDQCHEYFRVEDFPPITTADVRGLVLRMVDNGLDSGQADLEKIIFYLDVTYTQ